MSDINKEQNFLANLINAKKIMNKVETGDFARGNIDESKYMNNTDYEMDNSSSFEVNIPKNNVVNEDKIKNSKLPDVIKEAMINKPIQQISLNNNKLDIFENAKNIIEKSGLKKQKPDSIRKENKNTQSTVPVDYKSLSTLIENIVRKVFDEKINELQNKNNSLDINENLVLKVGDSIFSGNITKVKKK
jgi:hypothetical protein